MKIVKGIGKAVKGVVKGVGKVFKKVWNSKIGRALLIGAAIFVGGAALGMWGSPWAGLDGVLAGGAQTGPTVLAAGAGSAATDAAAMAAELGVSSSTAGAAGASLGANALGTAGLAGVEASGLAAQSPGLVGGLMTGAKSLAGKVATGIADSSPLTKAMMLNSAATMLSPDEVDVEREKQLLAEQQAEKDRERKRQNLSVGGINMGLNPVSPILYDAYGRPVYQQGLVRSSMRTT